MPSLIESDTFMPAVEWHRLDRWMARLTNRRTYYRTKLNQFIADGWTFEDPYGDSLGSLPTLESKADGLHFQDGEMEPYSNAIPAIWHMARNADFGDTWLDACWKGFYGEIPIERGDSSWLTAINSVAFFLSPQLQFFVGAASRDATSYMQVKLAMMLANVFCLDNRGRPLE